MNYKKGNDFFISPGRQTSRIRQRSHQSGGYDPARSDLTANFVAADGSTLLRDSLDVCTVAGPEFRRAYDIRYRTRDDIIINTHCVRFRKHFAHVNITRHAMIHDNQNVPVRSYFLYIYIYKTDVRCILKRVLLQNTC